MNTKYIKLLAIVILTASVFGGCKSSNNDDIIPTTAELVEDLPANFNTLRDGLPEDLKAPQAGSIYTYYDLSTDRTVSDSLSADWDIAFESTANSTKILANSAHGGGIMLVAEEYDDVTEAPTTGYTADNDNWYIYTGGAPSGPQHAIFPKENTTLLVKTSDGNFAKIGIISYYKGNPDTSTPEFINLRTRPESANYTFKYIIQNNGSTELFHEDSYTYFDLETEETVTEAESAQWDIGFNGLNILGNTENGGGVQLLNIEFNEVTEAPTEGYTATLGSNWYEYVFERHTVLPLPGKTIVIKTPEGNFAKIKIVSYYKGNPDTSSDDFINFIRPDDRHYTFEYAIQTGGSRFLSKF